MISIAKPLIGDEEKQAVLEVLDSGMLAQGPRVKAFEEAFAEMCGVRHAIATSSGTTALHVALLAHSIGPGDEVITTPFTFIASANSILYVGARPVFVDIDPATFNIDPAQIEAALTPRTKALMPVHLFGLACDMEPLVALAQAHDLLIIEDACQAHGARYKGRRTGGLGHVAAFSFYFSKNLGAYGEAGMITTNDDGLAQKMRMLRDHGSSQRYHHELIGLNGRLDEIQAAVLRAKLAHLESWNEQRRANAAHYAKLLSDLEVIVPEVADYAEHVFHLYAVRVPRRDELKQYLQERGVGTGIHYPIPCHLQPAFRSLGYRQGDLPTTEQVADEILSLPMYAELTAKQCVYVVNTIRRFHDSVGHGLIGG